MLASAPLNYIIDSNQLHIFNVIYRLFRGGGFRVSGLFLIWFFRYFTNKWITCNVSFLKVHLKFEEQKRKMEIAVTIHETLGLPWEIPAFF